MPLCVGWGQRFACLVAELPEKRCVGVRAVGCIGGVPRSAPTRACGLEPLLDLRPEVLVKDGGVRPGPGLLLVPGETAVDRVGQDLVDLAAAERATALHPAVRERLPLGAKVGRYEVALRLGLEKVPVIELGHLSEAEVTAYRIADNRIAELSEWDEGVLWA